MNHKRILALSITSAMVLAACQQPAPAPAVTTPVVSNVTANPSTVTQGNSASTTVTFSTTNGGGTISSAKANLAGTDTTCTLVSGSTSNYTCTVPVPSSLGTGAKTINVTVVNNAPTAATATGSTTVTVNPAPVVPITNPTFTATGPSGNVAAGTSTAVVITDLVAGAGTITGITASLNGGAAINCNLTANGTCPVPVPAGSTNGNNIITITATNSAGGSTSKPVSFNVTGGTGGIVPNNPVPGPLITNVSVGPVTLPNNAANAATAGTATVFINANAQGGATLQTVKILIDGVEVLNQTVPANQTGIFANYTIPVAATVAAGNRTLTITVVDSYGKQAVANPLLVVTRPAAPANAISGDAVVAGGTGVTSDDFDTNLRYRAYSVQQVDPSNGSFIPVFYVRGTIDLNTLYFGTETANPDIEFFSSNTNTSASNKLAARFITVGLNQGETYSVYARSISTGLFVNTSGGQTSLTFVPDNLAPQVPVVASAQQISQLRDGLKNLLGAWVNRSFDLYTDNTRTLEDNPANPGTLNPGGFVRRGTGIREVRYYAFPVDPNFIGDVGSIPVSAVLSTAIYLGNATNNTNPPTNTIPTPIPQQGKYNLKVTPFGQSINPNNFHSVTSGTALGVGDSVGQAALTAAIAAPATTPTAAVDGLQPNVGNRALLRDGRYVVIAVAYDYLGNRNSLGTLSGQNSIILNVDTVGAKGAFAVQDRGPLDVNATSNFVSTGPTTFTGNACNRVNILVNPGLAPTDVFTAENTYNPTNGNGAASFTLTAGGLAQTNYNFNTDPTVIHNGAGSSPYVSGCAVVSTSSDFTDPGIGFDIQSVPALSLGSGQFNFNIRLGAKGSPVAGGAGLVTPQLNLAPTVVNYNNVQGRQSIGADGFVDALGNYPESPAASFFFVDNTAPTQPSLTYGSSNGSNQFLSGQQLGLQAIGSDSGSRLRTNSNERFQFFYGTSVADNLPFANNTGKLSSFDFSLVQIPQLRLGNDTLDNFNPGSATLGSQVNLNTPNPLQTPSTNPIGGFIGGDTSQSALPGQVGKLGLTVVSVDKAGNARANGNTINVQVAGPSGLNSPSIVPVTTTLPTTDAFSPFIYTDVGYNSFLGFLTGTSELDSTRYSGFTVLNRNLAGIVDLNTTRDELNPSNPLFASFGGQTFGFQTLNQNRTNLGRLPTLPQVVLPDSFLSPSKNTNAFELTLPANQVVSRGNNTFQQGLGTVNFYYRANDPQTNIAGTETSVVDAGQGVVNPATLPNNLFFPVPPLVVDNSNEDRTGSRYLYNLPEFAQQTNLLGTTAFPAAPRVQHIWYTIPFQDVAGQDNALQDGYYKAIVGDSSRLNHNGVMLLAYNNYGNAAMQLKTSFATFKNLVLNAAQFPAPEAAAVDGNLATAFTGTSLMVTPQSGSNNIVNLVSVNVPAGAPNLSVKLTYAGGGATQTFPLSPNGAIVRRATVPGLVNVTKVEVFSATGAFLPGTTDPTNVSFTINELQVLGR